MLQREELWLNNNNHSIPGNHNNIIIPLRILPPNRLNRERSLRYNSNYLRNVLYFIIILERT